MLNKIIKFEGFISKERNVGMNPVEIILTPSFIKSLGRLTREEQKSVDLAIMQFWRTPNTPGLRWHPLNMRERRFHSISPNRDLRVIVLAEGSRRVMMYVDHHDGAYAWAEGRRFEKHPVTGSGQIVEFEEVVRRQVVHVIEKVATPPLFAAEDDTYLLNLGVPPIYLDWVKQVADEDSLIDLCQRLPEEASEALLALFSGQRPSPQPSETTLNPFETPDARRRFWIAADENELSRALKSPWAEWAVFLHPSQRDAVLRNFRGPARVTGAAGTGKSVVAMHRTAELARASGRRRLLLTTYSRALSYRLSEGMDRLLGSSGEVREAVTVKHLHAYAMSVLRDSGHRVSLLNDSLLKDWIASARGDLDPAWTNAFLENEWTAIIDYWGIRDFPYYASIPRTGRGKALSQRDRARLWPVFDEIHRRSNREGYASWGEVCEIAGDLLTQRGTPPFHHVVVDEAQDLGPRELAFVKSLASPGPLGLFFAGDTGQRIYRWPFPWSAVGVDVRGRARRLTLNYRTSQEIRKFADRLMPAEVEGPDGSMEDRRTVSLLSGPDPEIIGCESAAVETKALTQWLTSLRENGVTGSEIAILARTSRIHRRITERALSKLGLDSCDLTQPGRANNSVSVGTLHSAKGLEFRAVAVIGCDDQTLPLPAEVAKEQETEAKKLVIERERFLLYVAFTRARDSLLLTYTGRPSKFLDGLTSATVSED